LDQDPRGGLQEHQKQAPVLLGGHEGVASTRVLRLEHPRRHGQFTSVIGLRSRDLKVDL